MADNRSFRSGGKSDRPSQGKPARGGRRYESRDGERRYAKRDDNGGERRYGRRGNGEEGERRYGRRSEGSGERRYEKKDGERRFDRAEGRDGESRQYRGGKKHAQRGGRDRDRNHNGPQRSGYRDERMAKRQNEPDLPGDLDVRDLDPLVLQDLKVLSNDNAQAVAKHLIMAATWMADDPQLALRHARAAKDRAGRVAVVRETAGIAAYHAGEWKEALSELRAARRMSGGPGLIAVMADCERGLGRPEKAIDVAREFDESELDPDTRIELAIVVAGARLDLNQVDSAVITLQRAEPNSKKKTQSYARLSYAYADALSAAGRIDDARSWFAHAKDQDVDGLLDADERLKELG
ncbi:hypothetical protein [Corynebacterium vitaeruminis]|uniref:TPR-repeat-containing protein n=1 Tax=Corynebacterium vitaeruminis DSM 20294 TaxID=1224164 RepID=W5Y1F1_9CORY|nr:hypothetical protein [Corynebacterium vitaeruminis]AHI22715.1 hypothetical protein B843_06650 [Corynebacterium vitaeruminis DSM 20294]